MVKINNKSKRIACKRRYRIEKRIKDHNKKVRKEKAPGMRKTKKKVKNMVVPKKSPFREEVMALAEQKKQTNLDEKKKAKEERKKLKAEKKNQENNKEKGPLSKSLDDLLKQAQKKQELFNKQTNIINMKTNPFDDAFIKSKNNEKETSLKTFYKEFRKVIDAADVLIEVLDARDPLGSRCPQVEDMIINSGKNKKLILLLNKIDLVPKENVQAWLKYLRSQYPTVAFKASTQNQNEKLSQSNVPIDLANQNLLTSSKCLGADILLKLLNNYTRVNDIKQTITVGIIGLPNVGKSSIINSLKRSHACMIGSMPGLTRCMQEIKLDKHIKLLDCPGIVMSRDQDSASLTLKSCIRIESLVDPVAPVELLLKRCNKEQLIVCYKISEFKDVTDFLTQIAKRCGKIKKNGIPDLSKAAQLVLNDWTSGKLTFYTQPPVTDKVLETKIITEFSQGFDIESLFNDEKKIFDSIDDTKIIVDGVEVPSSEPTKVNFEELEKISEEKIEEDSDEDDDEEFETEDDDDDDEEIEDMEDSGNTDANGELKTDVMLNSKLIKKLEKEKAEKLKQQNPRKFLKKKPQDDEDNENEIYKSENIPRSKKMLKMEIKKNQKKAKRNDKIFSNLGDMLNNVKIASKSKDLKKLDSKIKK